MSEPAIRISGLRKSYRDLVALDGIDLEVGRGEIFGVVGPNGAGKTTLIRLLVGALRADAGTIEVLGMDPRRNRRWLRSRLGYMPQQPALYEDLSARRNVAFFAAAHPQRELAPLVDAALSRVALDDRADDPVHTLSGGMQQRLSLACAIAHEPELLLLDEPTAGIDPELRSSFWDHFRSLANAGSTLIVSTHMMTEALACDQIAVLRAGQVLVSDDPRRLMARGRARVRLFRDGSVEDLVLDDYAASLPALMSGKPVDRVEVERESLEDVVLGLIRSEGAEIRKS
jgi:ABC-2 type transport system ATP-binding protein